jgi:hypothetical protein
MQNRLSDILGVLHYAPIRYAALSTTLRFVQDDIPIMHSSKSLILFFFGFLDAAQSFARGGILLVQAEDKSIFIARISVIASPGRGIGFAQEFGDL